jgi:hypothetical protein
MYQQNAIITYVKYVSIKMLHTSHAMQFVVILCHMIAYQQYITKYYTILCHTMHINKMPKTHMPSMYQSKYRILVVQCNL